MRSSNLKLLSDQRQGALARSRGWRISKLMILTTLLNIPVRRIMYIM